MDSRFLWTDFYQELANKLLTYKNNRSELIFKLKQVFEQCKMKYPFTFANPNFDGVCPFSTFACFNKGISDSHRIELATAFKKVFALTATVPERFDGIPVVHNMSAYFYYPTADNVAQVLDELWDVFEAAINYANSPSEIHKVKFVEAFDTARMIDGIKWNLTMGLYWIRPFQYLNLDSKNRPYLVKMQSALFNALDIDSILKTGLPSGESYLQICDACSSALHDNQEIHSFPELSYRAWIDTPPVDTPINKSESYAWLVGAYSLGDQHDYADEFIDNGIWENGYDNKYINEVKNVKIGDKLILKSTFVQKHNLPFDYKGKSASGMWIKAIGQVKENLGDGKTLKVEWKRITPPRPWFFFTYRPTIVKVDTEPLDKPFAWKYKALLDFALNGVEQDYSKFLNEPAGVDSENFIYSKGQFLDDVFLAEAQYEQLVSLLQHKKNIIIQGAPGVGKTFAAKRLAYSIMGLKEDSNIEFVQFHQNYSYEDFVMGYKPRDNGFALRYGVFYRFCKEARNNPDNDYYFIIDEINRGNLSKIFGELLMLIENDKRDDYEVSLAYTGESFTVPGNIYIIGLMNTADRSLAMIDYALRRRFSFFEMSPGFDSEGFKKYQRGLNNSTFDKLIDCIKRINAEICDDPALGKGFSIGHSYFCGQEQCTDSWMKEIIDYDILPMLNEYWFDDQAKVQHKKEELYGVFND